MATITYLGKKKSYGPLALPWLSKEIKFDKNGLAKGVKDDVALAVEKYDPVIFKAGALKVVEPKMKQILDDDVLILQEDDDEDDDAILTIKDDEIE